MRILLVRHGESQANFDKQVNQNFPDHMIGLTLLGAKQAQATGKKIYDFYDSKEGYRFVRFWNSPYLRAWQTSQIIQQKLIELKAERCIEWDSRENINLVEQQFGLFDGIPDEELAKRFPAESAYYNKCEKHQGKFWARMPLGESRFDVAVRVHAAFGTFHRDAERHGIKDIIVVSHGVTIRAFVMQWLHKSVQWFEEEPNPKNCSIRLIDDGKDCGYL